MQQWEITAAGAVQSGAFSLSHNGLSLKARLQSVPRPAPNKKMYRDSTSGKSLVETAARLVNSGSMAPICNAARAAVALARTQLNSNFSLVLLPRPCAGTSH